MNLSTRTFDYDSFRSYIREAHVRYLDVGSSSGGSLQKLEALVRVTSTPLLSAGAGATEPVFDSAMHPAVLGIDISDEKLRRCNAHSPLTPRCVKADLRDLFPPNYTGHSGIVRGTQMLDILEHINIRTSRRVPAWRRRGSNLNGTRFDTASHSTAVELWSAACAASTDFCYMEGPSFDNEAQLRAMGFMMYWQAWTGHVAHLNSTSLLVPMLRSGRSGTRVVLLLDSISYSNDTNVMATPPSPLQSCDGGSAEFGCDRHGIGDPRYRRERRVLPKLRYPNTRRVVKLPDVYRRMWAVHAFHSRTEPLSPIVSRMISGIRRLRGYRVIHCDTTGSPLLVGDACLGALDRHNPVPIAWHNI